MELDENWRVVTYQIPVPNGDCSVHVRLSPEDATAIIMDGGEGDEAPDLIDQSWAEIKKEPGMDKLQLSGWVVTHWDTDHYKGTLAWLGGKGKAELAENAFLVAGKDPNKYGIKLPFPNDRRTIGPAAVNCDLFTGEQPKGDKDGRPVFLCLAADESAEKNKSSILAVIYWPTQKRCSFYTGGDGNPKAAKDGFDRLDVKASNAGRRVVAMKLDHHGSTKEFNTHIEEFKSKGTDLKFDEARMTNLTTFLLPRYIVATPGSMYGHPSWDMVYLLYLFYCGLSEIYPRVGYHKTVLYSTRTPTWNIQAKNVKNKLSTAKSSWDGAEKAFEYVKLLLKALQRDTGEEKSLDVEKCTMDKCLEDYNQLKESSPKKKHKTEWGGNEVEKDKKEEDTRICLANTASDWWNWLSPIKVSEEPGSFYLVCFTFYADETKEEAPTNKKLAQAKT